MGFALSMISDINVVFVRKGESTHGDMIEGPNDHSFSRYAFLDDFVASGTTRNRVHDELLNYAEQRGGIVPQRVLTIDYQTRESRSGFPEWRQQHREPSFLVARWSDLPRSSADIGRMRYALAA
ncbi:hypothetical protein ACQUFY_05805 [Robbsia andropogonis]|uniref:hypothetical protein n=1 Tax=Robbsia andropogonis TaxID=28092 RepID=UPI003D25706A